MGGGVPAAIAKGLVKASAVHVPDAWINHSKIRIGYEIPFTRQVGL